MIRILFGLIGFSSKPFRHGDIVRGILSSRSSYPHPVVSLSSFYPIRPFAHAGLFARAGLIAFGLLAVALLVVPGVASQALSTVPVYGESPVGYTAFTLDAGLDTLTSQPGDRRRLLVETWFPAREPGSVRKRWATDAVGSTLASSFPFPPGFHADITTHAWLDAEPIDAALPVVVFSHGLSFPPTLYQSFFEDLASRGYAVLAVSHPHGALMIDYPDGTTLDMTLWPQIDDEVQRQRMLAEAADVWAADLAAVVDALSAGELPIDFAVEASQIGLVGHSLGGTAAGKLAGRDERLSGVVVMEGDVRNVQDNEARGTLQVVTPLLHLIGGYNRLELERASYLPGPDAPVFTAVVRGTGHAYFSDLIHFYRAYADRAWHERHRYEVDPDRVIRISSDYIAAFLDWQLRDAPISSLLRRPSYSDRVDSPRQGGYPEVDLTIAIQ